MTPCNKNLTRRKAFSYYLAASLFMFLLFSASVKGQVSFQDFGTGTGTHSSGESTTFISAPSGSGTSRVRIGTGSGSLVKANPGNLGFGSGTELRISAATGGSVNKYSQYNYTAGNQFYTKFFMRLGNSSGNAANLSGSFYFFQGSGGTYSNNNTFSGSEVFTGLRFVFGNNTITTTYRSGGSWTSANISALITQGTDLVIEIVGNNSSSAVSYNYGGEASSVNANTFDLYVNHVLVGDNLPKALLANNANINALMFYGESSSGNGANIFLDDISVFNNIPANIRPVYRKDAAVPAWTTAGGWKPARTVIRTEDILIFDADMSLTGLPTQSVYDLRIEDADVTIASANTNAVLSIRNDLVFASDAAFSFVPASAATLSFNGTAAQHISGNGVLTIGTNTEFTLSNGNGLLISPASEVQINGVVNLADGTLTTNNRLTLNASSISAYGQISGAGTGNISGHVNVKKTLSNTNSGWRHIGLPVDAGIGSLVGLDKQFSNTQPQANMRNVFFWDATDAGDGNARGYTAVASTDTGLKGYAIYSDNAQAGLYEITENLSVSGNPNHGDKTFSLFHTMDPNSGNDPNGEGWNLVTNPYPGNIDVSALLASAGFDPEYKAIHIWDQVSGQYKAINVSSLINYNTTGGSLPLSVNIPPFQAFWVKSNAPSQELRLTNAVRTTDMPDVNAFMKRAFDVFRLQVEDAAGNKDQLAVCFDAAATEGFDNTMDLYKFRSMDTRVPTMYTSVDGFNLSLTALPDKKESYTVPFHFESAGNGKSYTFSALTSEYSSGLPVLLEDKKTGMLHSLSAAYTFVHDKKFASGRFVLHFGSQGPAAALEPEILQEISPNVFIREGQLIVRVKEVRQDTRVEVTDILGRRVYNGALYQGEQPILLSDHVKGFLLIKISSGNQSVTKRIIRN
jgi:hypothetical protein